MDKRNEYRIRPGVTSLGTWIAEFRRPRLFGLWSGWMMIDVYYGNEAKANAEAACRAHAGEGAVNLGRLP